ncbi:MAG: hydroxylase [Cyanobacteria bacterium J06606_4]
MQIHYLEIVTPDVETACALYSKMYGITFSDADDNLGGARTANLADDSKLGIRTPLRDTEEPVVRPYFQVEDIKASIARASESGADIAMMPTEIPGYGQFAIVIHGGIESGFWQL